MFKIISTISSTILDMFDRSPHGIFSNNIIPKGTAIFSIYAYCVPNTRNYFSSAGIPQIECKSFRKNNWETGAASENWHYRVAGDFFMRRKNPTLCMIFRTPRRVSDA